MAQKKNTRAVDGRAPTKPTTKLVLVRLEPLQGYRMVFARTCEHASSTFIFASTSTDQINFASSEHFKKYRWHNLSRRNLLINWKKKNVLRQLCLVGDYVASRELQCGTLIQNFLIRHCEHWRQFVKCPETCTARAFFPKVSAQFYHTGILTRIRACEH